MWNWQMTGKLVVASSKHFEYVANTYSTIGLPWFKTRLVLSPILMSMNASHPAVLVKQPSYNEALRKLGWHMFLSITSGLSDANWDTRDLATFAISWEAASYLDSRRHAEYKSLFQLKLNGITRRHETVCCNLWCNIQTNSFLVNHWREPT